MSTSPLANITREQRRQLERDNAKLPPVLTRIPEHQWPRLPADCIEVWRSKFFLVQVYQVGPGVQRLSINRTEVSPSLNRWEDGISWDTLQRLKRECGRGDFDAVEVFPRDRDIVNVANLRHLWVFTEPLPFAWRQP